MNALLTLGAGGLLTFGWLAFYMRVMRPEQNRMDTWNTNRVSALEATVVRLEGRLEAAEAKADAAEKRAVAAEAVARDAESKARAYRRALTRAGIEVEDDT